MPSIFDRREFLIAGGAMTVLLALGPPSLWASASQSIADVRFEAPYQQVDPSQGDLWTPTWGRKDALYTGNADGSGFGGIPFNTFAFGKLEGNDPYKLKGTTINGMGGFREPPQFGPETAAWKALESYPIEGVHYRFVACGGGADQSIDSCLMSSTDGGKAWSPTGGGRRMPLFRDTKFSAPSFISFGKGGLLVTFVIGNTGLDYVYAASYAAVMDGMDKYFIGRVLKSKLTEGKAADWSFLQSDMSWKANLEAAGTFWNEDQNGAFPLGPDRANWKVTSTYSVDGVLYMFITRCLYPHQSTDFRGRHIYQNSSIIKSIDEGRSWTRSALENYAEPMFPGQRFGTPYFVWYGQDGAATVDNADRYVYAVSNDGYFENGDSHVLGRVLRSKLANLSAADWSFYKAGDGMQDGNWTVRLDETTPILINPGRSSVTGVTYLAGLSRYVMVAWHYNRANMLDGIQRKDLSTVLEFFEAPKPWGPWTKVKTFETGILGWYAPIVSQRFQTTVGSNSVKAILYAAGLAVAPSGAVDVTRYKMNYLPITLSTKPLEHKDPAFVGGQ